MDRILSVEYETYNGMSVLSVVDSDTYEVVNKLYGEAADALYEYLAIVKK